MKADTGNAAAAAPIGIFDSGLGGLSIAVPIRRLLPRESLIYFADSAFCPYGQRPVEFLRQRAERIVEFLLRQGCKAIVVACNTATVAAIAHLREAFDLPIVGVEPAVRPAAAKTASGVVAVLATPSTLGSAQYALLVERYAADRTVLTQGCPGWVEAVEAGQLHSAATRALVAEHLSPLLDAGADTLVLGCTHFPFLRPLIEEVAGPQVEIVEPGLAVGRQLQRQLENHALLTAAALPPRYQFFSSGRFDATQLSWIESIWPLSVAAEQAVIP